MYRFITSVSFCVAGSISIAALTSPAGAYSEIEYDRPDVSEMIERDWLDLEIVERGRPKYPDTLAFVKRDGWVHMGFNILDNGSVGEVHVIASYPPKIFDKISMRALKTWKFATNVDGKAVNFPEHNQILLTHVFDGPTGVRRVIRSRLERARIAILEEKNYESAAELLDSASKQKKGEWLSLYELAAVEQTRTLLSFAQGNYDSAIDEGERTLRLGITLDEANILATHRLLFSSYINKKRYSDAVRVYDSWVELDPTVADSEITPTLERIRATLDEGRSIVIE